MARIRVAGVTLEEAPAPARLRIAGVTLTGTVDAAPRLRIAGVTLTGVAAIGVALGASDSDVLNLVPYDVITLTAATPSGFATPASYTWTSSRVTLTGTGNTRTFVVPRDMIPINFSVSVYGTTSGVNSDTSTLTMRAIPHLHWKFNDSLELVPVNRTRP